MPAQYADTLYDADNARGVGDGGWRRRREAGSTTDEKDGQTTVPCTEFVSDSQYDAQGERQRDRERGSRESKVNICCPTRKTRSTRRRYLSDRREYFKQRRKAGRWWRGVYFKFLTPIITMHKTRSTVSNTQSM